MAFEVGGRADKLGNRHEGRWVAKQLLRLLREEIKSVTIESIGDDEQGVDLWIELKDGKRQAQQCKARNASKEFWSTSDLKSRGILNNIRYQLDRDENCEFVFVSGVSNTVLCDICDSARNSNGSSEDFYNYQIASKGEASLKAFNEFCKSLSIDHSSCQGRLLAYYYLRRIRIILYSDDYNCWQDLLTEANYILSGNPEIIVSSLMSYAENNEKLGSAIYADELYNYFETKEIFPKNLYHDHRILPTIQKLQSEFRESITPRLIGKKLLKREETTSCIEELERNGLIVLHGSAGSGKSGVLYELTNLLNEKNIFFLPVRVDRRVPTNTAEQYGISMGLQDSPVFCLSAIAGERPCVLILDQLDAIRWTSFHSFNSLDVCKELIRQVLSLRRDDKDVRVVISCRSFDMDHDPELRNWLSGKDENSRNLWSKIEISPLNEYYIRAFVGEIYDQMLEKQKKLLSNPQNLYMWTELNNQESKPIIKSAIDLLMQFWKYKFYQFEKAGIKLNEINDILEKLVMYMEAKGKISAPSRILFGCSRRAEIELKSSGIIQDQNQVISFCHQSYLDYLIADKVVREIDFGENILKWIGKKENQTLFRREQLRQALNILSDDSPIRFLDIIADILYSKNVRFHLKHLVLEVIGQLQEINVELFNFCIKLLSEESLKSHVLDTVFLGHEVFVSELIDRGLINEWLDSDLPDMIEQAFTQLRNVTEKIPDKVADILKPYIDRNSEWDQKILDTIGWQISKDSDSMFELRIDLAKKGIISHFVNWKDICSTYPLRALKLIETVLSTYKDCNIGDRVKNNTRLEEWHGEDIKVLIDVARTYPEETWDMLIAHVVRLTDNIDYNYSIRMAWKGYWVNERQYQITYGVIKLINESGKKMALDMPERLLERVEKIKNSQSSLIQEIIAEVYSHLSKKYADIAILWLLQDPTRLEIGDPEYLLSSNIVQNLSPYCSINLFEELEKEIVFYHESDEKETAKRCLSQRKDGYYWDYWGKAQYILLSKLCTKRASKKASELLNVLKRRYEGCSCDDLLRKGRCTGGSIGSKLDKNLHRISDGAWLKIIENKKIPVDHSSKWKKVDEENSVETSVWQFSRSLETIAKFYPERFGELALKFNEDTHPRYVSAILSALQLTQVDSSFPEEIKNSWRPAPIDLVVKVIDKFLDKKDQEVAITFCRLIRNREDELWPEKIIKELRLLAETHPDLEEGTLNVYSHDWDKSMESVSIKDLFQNTINCVRGVAAEAIGQLLWNNYEMIDDFAPTIDLIVSDKHPVVRMASIYTLLPVINIDKDRAVKWFIKAANDDLRVPASHYAIKFINYTIRSHRSEIGPIIKSMMVSQRSDVSEKGAELITAYSIFYGYFKEELESCINGTTHQKKGVASVAAHFIADRDYSEQCRNLLYKLINDTDKEVKQKVSSMFGYDIFSIKENIPLVKEYIYSEAFSENSLILNKLEDYSGPVLEFSDIILDIYEALSTVHLQKTRENSRLRYMGSEISELLLRLYEQARENDRTLFNRCLDAWDMLFENRVWHVRGITQSIDMG